MRMHAHMKTGGLNEFPLKYLTGTLLLILTNCNKKREKNSIYDHSNVKFQHNVLSRKTMYLFTFYIIR